MFHPCQTNKGYEMFAFLLRMRHCPPQSIWEYVNVMPSLPLQWQGTGIWSPCIFPVQHCRVLLYGCAVREGLKWMILWTLLHKGLPGNAGDWTQCPRRPPLQVYVLKSTPSTFPITIYLLT